LSKLTEDLPRLPRIRVGEVRWERWPGAL